MSADAILDRHFAGRTFEVYSIASDEALTTPASFSDTFDEIERMGEANGSSNGMSIREINA